MSACLLVHELGCVQLTVGDRDAGAFLRQAQSAGSADAVGTASDHDCCTDEAASWIPGHALTPPPHMPEVSPVTCVRHAPAGHVTLIPRRAQRTVIPRGRTLDDLAFMTN